jgi:hypothetical protein
MPDRGTTTAMASASPRIGGTREALERNLRALEARERALQDEHARIGRGLVALRELIERERAALARYPERAA